MIDPRTRKRITLTDEESEFVGEEAEELCISESAVIRKIFSLGLEQYKEPKSKVSNDDIIEKINAATENIEFEINENKELLHQNEELLLGLTALVSWFMPYICQALIGNKNSFIRYFSNMRPMHINQIAHVLGQELREDDVFCLALKDIPRILDLDTTKFSGGKRRDWENACNKAAIEEVRLSQRAQERLKNGSR